jgi:hypothetical protein
VEADPRLLEGEYYVWGMEGAGREKGSKRTDRSESQSHFMRGAFWMASKSIQAGYLHDVNGEQMGRSGGGLENIESETRVRI